MADCHCSANLQVSNIYRHAQTSSGAYPTEGLIFMLFLDGVCAIVVKWWQKMVGTNKMSAGAKTAVCSCAIFASYLESAFLVAILSVHVNTHCVKIG
jgi:hypothetical protein